MWILQRVIPDNRGNFGPPEENLPVYSRDFNSLLDYVLSSGGIFIDGVLVSSILQEHNNVSITSDKTSLFNISLSNDFQVSQLILPHLITVAKDITLSSDLLTTISMPLLVSALNVSITGQSLLENFDLSSLQTCTSITMSSNSLSVAVDFSSLISAGSTISISANPSIPSIDLSNLTSTSALIVASNSSLTSLILGNSINCVSLNLTENAFTQACVDDILAKLVLARFTDGVADLSGGTNSPPSAAGLTSKTTLEGRNWVVTVNS